MICGVNLYNWQSAIQIKEIITIMFFKKESRYPMGKGGPGPQYKGSCQPGLIIKTFCTSTSHSESLCPPKQSSHQREERSSTAGMCGNKD